MPPSLTRNCIPSGGFDWQTATLIRGTTSETCSWANQISVPSSSSGTCFSKTCLEHSWRADRTFVNVSASEQHKLLSRAPISFHRLNEHKRDINVPYQGIKIQSLFPDACKADSVISHAAYKWHATELAFIAIQKPNWHFIVLQYCKPVGIPWLDGFSGLAFLILRSGRASRREKNQWLVSHWMWPARDWSRL